VLNHVTYLFVTVFSTFDSQERFMPVELRTVAAVLVLLLTSAWPAAAQTTFATITGAVTDSSGGVIAGAEVAATNVETSIATKTTTNREGVYTVTQLREGPYMLSITAPGLREFIVTLVGRRDSGYPGP
jgi:carboxypeptidase family protein